MNDIEEYQFKINTVNRIIDSHIEDWKQFSKSADELFGRILKSNKQEKNTLFAICGVGITLLFGLVSAQILKQNDLEYYLSLDIAVGIGIFIIYSISDHYLRESFLKPALAIINSQTYVEAHRLGFAGATYMIENVNADLIAKHFVMTYLIDGSNKIRITVAFDNLHYSKLIAKPVKQELNRITNLWKIGISNSVDLYKASEGEFEKENWKTYEISIKEIKDLSLASTSKNP